MIEDLFPIVIRGNKSILPEGCHPGLNELDHGGNLAAAFNPEFPIFVGGPSRLNKPDARLAGNCQVCGTEVSKSFTADEDPTIHTPGVQLCCLPCFRRLYEEEPKGSD